MSPEGQGQERQLYIDATKDLVRQAMSRLAGRDPLQYGNGYRLIVLEDPETHLLIRLIDSSVGPEQFGDTEIMGSAGEVHKGLILEAIEVQKFELPLGRRRLNLWTRPVAITDELLLPRDPDFVEFLPSFDDLDLVDLDNDALEALYQRHMSPQRRTLLARAIERGIEIPNPDIFERFYTSLHSQ